jgi:hypothetical protein
MTTIGTRSVLFGCDLNHIFAVRQDYGLFALNRMVAVSIRA